MATIWSSSGDADLLRRRVAHDVGDHQVTRIGDRVARVALVVRCLDLDTNAGELAGQAAERSGVLLLGQILAERVAKGREQAADRALDEKVRVDRSLADIVLSDVVVRVPERPEQVLVGGGSPGSRAGETAEREA